jgi:predicted DNA-binding transcriptional regulator AlpA
MLMNEKLAISAQSISAMLDISVRTFWNMHQNGTLGPVPISLSERVTRWDSDEVREWWKACRTAGRLITRNEWLRMREPR